MLFAKLPLPKFLSNENYWFNVYFNFWSEYIILSGHSTLKHYIEDELSEKIDPFTENRFFLKLQKRVFGAVHPISSPNEYTHYNTIINLGYTLQDWQLLSVIIRGKILAANAIKNQIDLIERIVSEEKRLIEEEKNNASKS